MKKIILCILTFLLIIPINVLGSDLAKNSKAAVIIENSTGKILYEKNKDVKRAPASMTKIMTLLLIMERIDDGSLKLDDLVYISKNAKNMGGSQIYLEENTYMSVENLIKGIAISSGNDASVAMAEHIGGTEENFVKMMNDKAKELGLSKTQFKNSHGLDEEGHYTTAYEMALIARELLKHPKILEYTSMYESYIEKDKNTKFWLVNTNKLVRFYKGVDGLKTGYTKKAGHCLTATMEKNDMRVITVVMESGSTENRSSETVSLLEYAFSMYSASNIINKGKLGEVEVLKGNKDKISYGIKDDIKIILSKTDSKEGYSYEIKLDTLISPIDQGQIIGKINVKNENKEIVNIYDIVSLEKVSKANIFITFVKNLKKISSGNI